MTRDEMIYALVGYRVEMARSDLDYIHDVFQYGCTGYVTYTDEELRAEIEVLDLDED